MERTFLTFKIAFGSGKRRVCVCGSLAAPLALLFVGCGAHRSIDNLRMIDFASFSYPVDRAGLEGGPSVGWHWLSPVPNDVVALKGGRHVLDGPEYRGDPHPSYLQLISVRYGDLTGGGADEAVVDLLFATGGTASWHYLYVYRSCHQNRGVPCLVGILKCGSRADGGLVATAIRGHLLVLDFFDSAHRVGDCCSSRVIRVRYRFQGGVFIEQGPREHFDAPSAGSH